MSSLAGNDSYSLSFALAFEQLLGNLDPPENPPACTGCTVNVSNVKVQTVKTLDHDDKKNMGSFGVQMADLSLQVGWILVADITIHVNIGGWQNPNNAWFSYMQNTWNGLGQPAPNDTWSFFGLTFDDCPSNGFFSEYGRNGITGHGTPKPASV